ncbi:MAG: DNA-formamidopyrimidine glycosylase family protein [Planctomycetota bacterium]|nr:DNA-formamidopyrimidine glycosylase family protein [Planctomycetota bacterium]
MPELPEVERGRRLAENVAAGRMIAKVKCARDPIVFEGMSPARWRQVLAGRRVIAVHRRGKYIFFELDARPWPVFHFGMTGGFVTPDVAALRLASSRKKTIEAGWPPRFVKIHLVLDDGGELVMTNKRRLGRIRLRTDPLNEPPLSGLGFDPLLDLPAPAQFVELLRRRSAIIKPLLMDQSFAAGVGNWIADEVLYQAHIDPRRRSDSLSEAEAKRIRSCLKRIVEKAVSVDADKKRFPRTWLFHRRWGKNSEAVTARGEKIRHITLGGRTTAWVPEVQR